jgi:hypothetical protein
MGRSGENERMGQEKGRERGREVRDEGEEGMGWGEELGV